MQRECSRYEGFAFDHGDGPTVCEGNSREGPRGVGHAQRYLASTSGEVATSSDFQMWLEVKVPPEEGEEDVRGVVDLWSRGGVGATTEGEGGLGGRWGGRRVEKTRQGYLKEEGGGASSARVSKIAPGLWTPGIK